MNRLEDPEYKVDYEIDAIVTLLRENPKIKKDMPVYAYFAKDDKIPYDWSFGPSDGLAGDRIEQMALVNVLFYFLMDQDSKRDPVMTVMLAHRLAENKSQEEVAKAAGVSLSTYRRWEKGVIQPPLDKAFKITDYLNFRIGEVRN